MLAALLNVPVTFDDWQTWAFAHDQNHAEMIAAIQQQSGVTLERYQLYPINFDRFGDFLERNQRAHNDINRIININSTDLQDVDPNQREQFIAWVDLHHSETFAMNARLGI